MSGCHQSNTPGLFSAAGTFGELQVVGTRDYVVVDVQSRNYDTTGCLHRDHAVTRLPLRTAMRLRDLLNQAIAASADFAPGSPGVWSNAAIRAALARADALDGRL
jgi:hypothetical protein